DQGLVEPSWHQRERGVPRKYYALTAEGRARLETLEAEWTRFSGTVADILAARGGDSRAARGEETK
ncbi:MAG: PadR family transcriptional regulator, partial [Thermoanaerobaculia bacterium]|nr:PadR family transcriptional regulator [Thermoanaerobaculia bacterium]